MHWKAYGRPVQIQILYVPECPNLAAARSRVQVALRDAGLHAIVEEIEVVPTIVRYLAVGTMVVVGARWARTRWPTAWPVLVGFTVLCLIVPSALDNAVNMFMTYAGVAIVVFMLYRLTR